MADIRTLVQSYKFHTAAVVEYLQRHTPSTFSSVRAMLEAAQHAHTCQAWVPVQVKHSVNQAIQLRREASTHYLPSAPGHPEHEYFIHMLEQVEECLRDLPEQGHKSEDAAEEQASGSNVLLQEDGAMRAATVAAHLLEAERTYTAWGSLLDEVRAGQMSFCYLSALVSNSLLTLPVELRLLDDEEVSTARWSTLDAILMKTTSGPSHWRCAPAINWLRDRRMRLSQLQDGVEDDEHADTGFTRRARELVRAYVCHAHMRRQDEADCMWRMLDTTVREGRPLACVTLPVVLLLQLHAETTQFFPKVQWCAEELRVYQNIRDELKSVSTVPELLRTKLERANAAAMSDPRALASLWRSAGAVNSVLQDLANDALCLWNTSVGLLLHLYHWLRHRDDQCPCIEVLDTVTALLQDDILIHPSQSTAGQVTYLANFLRKLELTSNTDPDELPLSRRRLWSISALTIDVGAPTTECSFYQKHCLTDPGPRVAPPNRRCRQFWEQWTHGVADVPRGHAGRLQRLRACLDAEWNGPCSSMTMRWFALHETCLRALNHPSVILFLTQLRATWTIHPPHPWRAQTGRAMAERAVPIEAVRNHVVEVMNEALFEGIRGQSSIYRRDAPFLLPHRVGD